MNKVSRPSKVQKIVALAAFLFCGLMNSWGIEITSSVNLTDGYVGYAFDYQATATGGEEPYWWEVLSGSLPEGISMDSSGHFTGTPTTVGQSTFVIQVTDDQQEQAQMQIDLYIYAAPLVNTTGVNLTDGYVGYSFDYQATATGGATPETWPNATDYTWSIVSGSLPEGITMDSTGNFTGTPTTVGQSTFILRVTDYASHTSDIQIDLYIYAAPLQNTTQQNMSGVVNQSFDYQATATGGATPETWPNATDYTWSIVSGTLPAGIEMDSSGHFTGAPTEAGSFECTLRVTDYASHTSDIQIYISINN